MLQKRFWLEQFQLNNILVRGAYVCVRLHFPAAMILNVYCQFVPKHRSHEDTSESLDVPRSLSTVRQLQPPINQQASHPRR